MEKLENKTTEQLQTALKTVQAITYALIGILSVLFGVTIYGLLTRDDNSVFIPLLVVAFSCSAILPMQFASMKKIKVELNSRKSND